MLDKQKKSGVSFVGLVGIGGSGKTTLARVYAKQSKNSVVWEINAETKNSIINSFKSLAYALAKTKKLREEIIFTMSIQNTEEKEKQIMSFVKSQLKNSPSWLLIYDNVSSLSESRCFLPFDSEVWGNGTVIITTRNENIMGSNFIESSNILQIQELNTEDSFSLFKCILNQKNPKLLSLENTKKLKELISVIPPFPLDISTAAYYVKNSTLDIDQYIKIITKNSQVLCKENQDFIQEVNDYTETRYSIIKLSIKYIINKNPKYANLLFLICLCDAQNIPLSFISFIEDLTLVNNFIYDLKKYSLIANSTEKKNAYYFSIHRSVQKIIIDYLMNDFKFKKKNDCFLDLGNKIVEYMTHVLNQKDIDLIKEIIPHATVLSSHKEILSKDLLTKIIHKLGQFYFIFGQYEKAVELFTSIIANYQDLYGAGHIETASVKKYLGHSLIFLRNYDKAHEYLQDSLRINQKHYGENHIQTASVKKYLGHNYALLGQYTNAKILLEESLNVHKHYYGEDHIETALVKKYLGYPYAFLGYCEASCLMVEQSLNIHQKYFGEDRIETTWVKAHLGRSYTLSKRYEEAKTLLEESLQSNIRHYGEHHIETAWVKSLLGKVYIFLKHFEKAKTLLEESLNIHRKQLGENHRDTLLVKMLLKEIKQLPITGF